MCSAPRGRDENVGAPNGHPEHSAPSHEGQSIPPRRRPLGALAQGRHPYRLRADGSVVRRIGSGTWNVITLKGKTKKGLTVEEVHELLADAGYMHE